MLKKTVWLCLMAASWPAFAQDDDIQQRLWQNTRQMDRAQEREVWEKDAAAQATIQSGEAVTQDTGAVLYEAVNRSDWAAVRRLLGRYEQQADHDKDVALLARAALARADGKWKQSKQHYETLLERQPDFTRGRLDLARLLYEGHLNREAASQFVQIARTEDLPESVRENVESFQTALNKRDSWRGSAQIGAVWNSNINQSPGAGKEWCVNAVGGECGGVLQADPVENGVGARYETTAVRRWQVKGHHGVTVRGIAYGTVYRNQKARGAHTANLSAGYQFENHRDSFTLAPVFEWNGSGGKTEHRNYGVRGEWERSGGNWLWNTELEWTRLDYVERYKHSDGRMFSANNTLTYIPRHDVILYAGLDYQRRKAANDVFAYRQASARIGAVKIFPQGFSTALNATFRRRTHDGYEKFFENRRRDNEQIYTLGLNADRWKVAGLKPVLNLKHRRVNGNIGLNSYKQNEIGLALQKTF
ncbi:surface lipoprotein assembly modifier [Neisseria sp. Dent CA1/247]|uniref:surface lipoprotein assembly modifier n=1 Tax=Neisseria sp. Dent CA1/247 TaxID=2912675 RepID=UPI001FD33352|nr:surface lipoprotein assembly modifier [Neisseria sp. Dent CA1/247]UOO77080.1 surface lipoprotein assembly modifier [Neisseria sp. Dent CA1/247]